MPVPMEYDNKNAQKPLLLSVDPKTFYTAEVGQQMLFYLYECGYSQRFIFFRTVVSNKNG